MLRVKVLDLAGTILDNNNCFVLLVILQAIVSGCIGHKNSYNHAKSYLMKLSISKAPLSNFVCKL